MTKLSPALALSAFLLASCTHAFTPAPIALPTSQEVASHVAWRWAADFNRRFGRPAQLVSVENVGCIRTFGGGVAECAYEVRARYAGGQEVTRQLRSQFQRDTDGALTDALVLWRESSSLTSAAPFVMP